MSTARVITPRPVRLGLLGFAPSRRAQLEVLLRERLAELSAVLEPDPRALAAARKLAPSAEPVGDLDTLLGLDLDGIVFGSPRAEHGGACLAAIAAGRAIFCHAPLSRTATEVRALIAAARAKDVRLGAELGLRHTRALELVRELIEDGSLGEVFAAELVFHSAYGPDAPPQPERRRAGGGALIELGSPLLDAALWCLDFPEVLAVAGDAHRDGRRLPADDEALEDHASGLLQLAGGTTLQLACSWRASIGADARLRLTFLGTRGGAELADVDGSPHRLSAARLRGSARDPLGPASDDGRGRALVRWARALGEARSFAPEALRGWEESAAALDRWCGRRLSETVTPR